jgi:uncharacterized protein (TIGR02246 family)
VALISAAILLLAGCAAWWEAEADQNRQPLAKRSNPPPAPSAEAIDLAAIEGSADAFTEAYQRGDARAIAALFTPEGEFVDGLGRVLHGREAIEAAFADAFAESPGAKIVIDMDTVRLIGAGLIAEDGSSRIIPADDAPVTASQYVVMHSRQPDGKWLMASVRTTRDEPATPHDHLKPLAWLLGAWVDESPESVVETRWRWSDTGNYLLGDFDVKIGRTAVMKGTQRIGWDPNRQQIRSWVFDSQGGFTEGEWTETDEGWVVKASGVSSDGEAATATNIYARTGPDSFLWTSKDRIEGNELLPTVEVKVVRAPPPAEVNAGQTATRERKWW